jgi:hypothetical protein
MKSGVLLPILLGLWTAATRAEAVEVQDQGCFGVWVPPGFTISKYRGPDFDVHTLSKNGNDYLAVYSGNAPQFPPTAAMRDPQVTILESRGVTTISRWQGDQLVGRDMLIWVKPSGWPGVLYAYTLSTDPTQVRLADKIMSSLSVHGDAAACK